MCADHAARSDTRALGLALLTRVLLLMAVALLASVEAAGAPFAVGAAPQGDAKAVGSRIIKYNFPACRNVSSATRQADGSIRATCDGVQYLVFTLFNAKEGKMTELAMNCTAARKMGVNC